ncbi:MAG TPA: hypothetical protein VJA21_00670 [Verrucomicrobiae bacterium]
MEKYLQNLEVWCWRYKENTRNYPGLHFTAKPAACDAISGCLRQLRKEGDGARRTIPLRPLKAEDEAKISGGQKYECFSRLRITIHAESDQLRQMAFRVESSLVHLDFTERSMSGFEKGLSDVKAGRGDYAIEPEEDKEQGRRLGELERASKCLWFWPCFGHLEVVS